MDDVATGFRDSAPLGLHLLGMAGISPPTRVPPVISCNNPPVLLDFVSNVPAPVTRLLVEQAGTIRVMRRAAEIASWKSSKSSESWLLLAAWWFICGSAYFGVRRATMSFILVQFAQLIHFVAGIYCRFLLFCLWCGDNSRSNRGGPGDQHILPRMNLLQQAMSQSPPPYQTSHSSGSYFPRFYSPKHPSQLVRQSSRLSNCLPTRSHSSLFFGLRQSYIFHIWH